MYTQIVLKTNEEWAKLDSDVVDESPSEETPDAEPETGTDAAPPEKKEKSKGRRSK
jgi:hypothetical protein